MHAGKIAEELEMEKIIVPYSPGTFSAMGLVLSDIKSDCVHTRLLTPEQMNPDVLNAIFDKLDAQGMASLEEQDVPPEDRMLVRTCDMRYFGQAFEISVPLPTGKIDEQGIADLIDRFHELHRYLIIQIHGDGGRYLCAEHGVVPLLALGTPQHVGLIPERKHVEGDGVGEVRLRRAEKGHGVRQEGRRDDLGGLDVGGGKGHVRLAADEAGDGHLRPQILDPQADLGVFLQEALKYRQQYVL